MNSLLQAESRIVPKLNCVKKHLSAEKFQEGGHKLSNCYVFLTTAIIAIPLQMSLHPGVVKNAMTWGQKSFNSAAATSHREHRLP